MTTQALRHTVAQPPPFDMDLVDAGRVVGWITGKSIGFRGFRDETEATHAAWVAYRTLARRIARRHGMRLVPSGIEPLALKRGDDGETEVILASDRPIATLIRPGSHSRVSDSFGFALAVPSPMAQFELRGVAYLIYRTLRKSGVGWAIWRGDAPARAQRVMQTEEALPARALEPIKQPRRPAGTFVGEAFRWLGNGLRLTTDAIRGLSRGWHPTVYK
jgi:hypothetical protein